MHDQSFENVYAMPDGAACGAQALAHRLDRQVADHWAPVRVRHQSRLERAFAARGPVVYDTYLLLTPRVARFSPQAQWYPRLPGGMVCSHSMWQGGRRCRERWLTLALCGLDDVPLGMLVIAVQKNLERFEIVQRPRIFALGCMGIEAVRAELARCFAPGIENELERVIDAQPA